jgi:hypothetical protein
MLRSPSGSGAPRLMDKTSAWRVERGAAAARPRSPAALC